MSKIKSFSVGSGDMFYIRHGSANLTIIDCCLSNDNKHRIVQELANSQRAGDMTRFISTHPDQDHIQGLGYLHDNLSIQSFYCVKNATTKDTDTVDFRRYCQLHDSDKAYHIYKGCSRKWMNKGDNRRGSAGINILWPDRSDQNFKQALSEARRGRSPNNISPIIQYRMNNGVTALWMGDLETPFMKSITRQVALPKADLLFAPHHGRKSGRVPLKWLEEIQPNIVIVGEAPSDELTYYSSYNTITQNTAGDITFDCSSRQIHVYASRRGYSCKFLVNRKMNPRPDGYYIGSFLAHRQ
ncbi:MAG: hypothetical protein F4Z34_13175 [Acidimicrobiaceae bacterium]|nr:hypothetical protein [Acidimicrobiaceae bacterium]